MNQTIIYRHSTISRYLQANKHNAKEIRPTTRHMATLRRLYINPHRRLPQAFTQTHKRKQEKKLELPCCASTHSTTAPSSGLAPLEHVRLDNVHLSTTLPGTLTCASPRALPSKQPLSLEFTRGTLSHCHVRFSTRLLPRAPRQHVLSQAASALFSHSTLVRAFQARLTASSFLSLLSDSTLSVLSATLLCPPTRPALFWARCIHLRQSGGHATPPPRCFSLQKQADTEPSQQRSARAFWRETSPPPRRVSIRSSGECDHTVHV